MAWELREGQGSLFKNGKREKDSQPNARGECKIDGVVYEVSAWTKKTKAGDPWQSLSFKRKGEGAQRVSREPKPQSPEPTDIPF